MFILFSLIVMRMSGAIALNPVFGRTNVPARVKAAFILVLSLMLYIGSGGILVHEPAVMAEYGVMLLKELLFGFTLGFGMELAFLVVRFASSIMDYSMGLTMAQVYDPQYNAHVLCLYGNAFSGNERAFEAARYIFHFFRTDSIWDSDLQAGADAGNLTYVSGKHCHGTPVRVSVNRNGAGCGNSGGDTDADDSSD